jgi:hypothetical protein
MEFAKSQTSELNSKPKDGQNYNEKHFTMPNSETK